MNFKQIQYFLTIVNEGQITKAAEKLHMAQPPLSYQLKRLEQELGVQLIERNRKKISLTKEGEILYSKGTSLIKQVEDIEKEVQETSEGLRGTLEIGSVKSYFGKLSNKLISFHQENPDVTFKLISEDTSSLLSGLNNGEIELAIVKSPFKSDNLSMLSIPDEYYVAIVSKERIKKDDINSISLNELAQMPLLLLHRSGGSGQSKYITDHFKSRGYEPNIICECPDAAVLLNLVSSGMGVSVLPNSTLLISSLKNIKKLKIKGDILSSDSFIVWKKNRYLSKIAQNFLMSQFFVNQKKFHN